MQRTDKHARLDEREQRLRGLLLGGLGGDERAYRVFLTELAAHLRPFLRRHMFGWPDDVEDLVQECLLAVHNKRHTYDTGQPLTAWVHAIARYKLIDQLRRRGSAGPQDALAGDEIDVLASAANDAADARRDLSTLLRKLPDRHRLPIVYVKIEGLSVAEAARRCGMSESAVKIGVHRGLKALAAIVRDAP